MAAWASPRRVAAGPAGVSLSSDAGTTAGPVPRVAHHVLSRSPRVSRAARVSRLAPGWPPSPPPRISRIPQAPNLVGRLLPLPHRLAAPPLRLQLPHLPPVPPPRPTLRRPRRRGRLGPDSRAGPPRLARSDPPPPHAPIFPRPRRPQIPPPPSNSAAAAGLHVTRMRVHNPSESLLPHKPRRRVAGPAARPRGPRRRAAAGAGAGVSGPRIRLAHARSPICVAAA